MVEKVVEIGIMFDFYGKLLTERQYIAMELYYLYDYSLAEIGEELEISRQAVYDLIKRSEEKLYELENVLRLVEKFNLNRKEIEKIARLVEDIEKEAAGIENHKIGKKIEGLRICLGEIMMNS